MELNKYHTINEIHSDSYDWSCRVRLQCLWKGMNRETREFWGLNMIFIDDSNYRIHAFASAKYCDEIIKTIKEGDVYVLSNFKVKDFVGDETYRPVRTDKHIYFTPHTKLEKADSAGLSIEPSAFDFIYLGEIEKMTVDNRFLIDIAGKVENIQTGIKSIKNNEEKTRLKFELSDGRFRVNVTLFDDLAYEIERAFSIIDLTKLYVIISFAKLGVYEGAANITNYPATRVLINPDHHHLIDLKNSIKDEPAMDIEIEPPVSALKMFTIKQIRTLSSKYNETYVRCEAIVKKIDEKATWYYSKCTACENEIQPDNGTYKCADCKRIIPFPDKRFRLCTICSDHSGSIVLILPDEEIVRIIDKTVIDIQSEVDEEGDEEKFPEILRIFLKKKYTITVEIKESNTNNGSTVYEAKEIKELMDVSDSFDPNEKSVTEPPPSSIIKDSQLEMLNSETPTTGKSTNAKIRARTSNTPIAFDGDADEKIKALKNIKREKI